MYEVLLSKNAIKKLQKIDSQIRKMILNWIDKNLTNVNDPRIFGKNLSHDKKDVWRYRIGSYRLLCNIADDKLIILVIEVGRRKEIYK